MKKALYLFLATILLVGATSGCKTKNNNSTITIGNQEYKIGDTGGLKLPLDKKNTPLTYVVSSSITDLNDKFVIQKLREITGIQLNVEAYTVSTINEKVKVLVASKKLPDILGAGLGSDEAVNDLGVQGAFVSIDDKLDLMPNLKRIVYDNPDNSWFFNSYQAKDGHTYAIPLYDIQRDVNHGMLYRKDIFDQHGLQVWNNTQEFYECLKKLKEYYPNSTPFTSKNQENIFNQLSVSWGINAYQPYYDEEEKIWKYSDTDPKMKDMLDFLHKMYQEGLFDPEFLTLTQAAWTQKMTQYDKTFTTYDWIGRLEMFQEQTKDTIPTYDLRYAPPIGPKGTVITLPKIGTGSVVSNGENYKLALQLSDFLLSDAGAELITMGIEGETYTLNEKGKANYIGFDEGKALSINDLEEKYGMFVQGMYKRFDRRSVYFNFTQREQEAQDFATKNNRFEPADPKLVYLDEEKEVITNSLPTLRKAASEFFINYVITDNTGDEAWSKWVEKANSLGAENLVSIYNEAQKRFTK